MQFRFPLPMTRFFRGAQPLPRRHKSSAMLALERQSDSQLDNSIKAKPHRAKPAAKPLVQAGDSLVKRSLRAQHRTAQEPRLHNESEPLLGNERLTGLEPLQRGLRLPELHMKDRVPKQRIFQGQWVSDTLGHCQSFSPERQALLGIPEHPMDLPANIARAYARIVSAIEQAMRAVSLWIIELAPCLAMLAGGRRLACEQTGRPGAVMGLQPQSVVRLACGQLLQPVRQSAAV